MAAPAIAPVGVFDLLDNGGEFEEVDEDPDPDEMMELDWTEAAAAVPEGRVDAPPDTIGPEEGLRPREAPDAPEGCAEGEGGEPIEAAVGVEPTPESPPPTEGDPGATLVPPPDVAVVPPPEDEPDEEGFGVTSK